MPTHYRSPLRAPSLNRQRFLAIFTNTKPQQGHWLVGGLLSIALLVGCDTSSAPSSRQQSASEPTATTSSPTPAAPVGSTSADSPGSAAPPAATLVDENSVQLASAAVPAGRVHVESTRFDFGRLSPQQTGETDFVIKNVGAGPLQLFATETSCNCTVGHVPSSPIAPGESAQVHVKWKTNAQERRFQQSITLRTTDPAQPEIQLWIYGEVLPQVAATPSPLSFGELAPDASREISTLIHSRVMRDFQLEFVDIKDLPLAVDLQPASEAQLAETNSLSGWQLKVKLSEDLPVGEFQHRLRFRCRSSDAATSGEVFEIPIAGKILRRIAVHGPDIDHTGTIRLMPVRQHQGYQATYIVKLRDADPELRVLSIQTHPKFVEAELAPYATSSGKRGLYRLQLRIPPDSPLCDHSNSDPGRIQLTFDHPRAPSLDLDLRFAVVGTLRETTQQPKTLAAQAEGSDQP